MFHFVNPFSIDDDDTLNSYDIIFVDKHGDDAIILGQADLPDNPAVWSWYMIGNLPHVASVHGGVLVHKPNGKVELNTKLPGFNFDGKPYIRMRLRYGTPKKRMDTGDWCLKCEARGTFIKMALVCPDCGDLLGGC